MKCCTSHGCPVPARAAGFARVLVGWDMTAGQKPSSSLPSSSSAEQAALQKVAALLQGIWDSGSVGVKACESNGDVLLLGAGF